MKSLFLFLPLDYVSFLAHQWKSSCSTTNQAGLHPFQVSMPRSFRQVWILMRNGGKTIWIVMMHLPNPCDATSMSIPCCQCFLVWSTSVRMFGLGPCRPQTVWSMTHALVHRLHEPTCDFPKIVIEHFLFVSIQIRLPSRYTRISAVVKARWSSEKSSCDNNRIPQANLGDT